MDELLDWEQDSSWSEVQPREAVRAFSLGLLASAFPHRCALVCGCGLTCPCLCLWSWRSVSGPLSFCLVYLLFFFMFALPTCTPLVCNALPRKPELLDPLELELWL